MMTLIYYSLLHGPSVCVFMYGQATEPHCSLLEKKYSVHEIIQAPVVVVVVVVVFIYSFRSERMNVLNLHIKKKCVKSITPSFSNNVNCDCYVDIR